MKETPAVIDYLQPCTTMGLSWCAGQRVGVSHVLFRSWFFGQRFECSKLRRCRLKSTCGGWRLHDRGIWPCGHQGHGWRLQAIGDRPDHKFEFRSSRAYQPEDRRLRNSRKTQPGGADGRRRRGDLQTQAHHRRKCRPAKLPAQATRAIAVVYQIAPNNGESSGQCAA